MLRKFGKKRAAAVATVASLAVAGGAFAYFTTSGSGTGSATVGSDTGVTFKNVSAPTGLYPGDPAQALNYTISNAGPSKQYVASVTITIDAIKDAGGNDISSSCAASNFTVTQPTDVPGSLTVGDHAVTNSGGSIAMNETNTNQDGCKNAVLTLGYHANAS